MRAAGSGGMLCVCPANYRISLTWLDALRSAPGPSDHPKVNRRRKRAYIAQWLQPLL